jgi:hypothetical protein
MKLTGYASIIGNTKPTIQDTTSETLVYEGYTAGNQLIICKIDLTTPIVTRKYAVGAWADRATLSYN